MFRGLDERLKKRRGKLLRDWRLGETKGQWGEPWTQQQAAGWYGVHERTWRRWENGETRVPEHVFKRADEFKGK